MIDFVVSATLAAITASNDSGVAWLLAIGPASAVGLYWMLFRFYRNTDKSHSYERETRVTADPVTGDEAKVDEIKGTKEDEIAGRNDQQFRQRVERVR